VPFSALGCVTRDTWCLMTTRQIGGYARATRTSEVENSEAERRTGSDEVTDRVEADKEYGVCECMPMFSVSQTRGLCAATEPSGGR